MRIRTALTLFGVSLLLLVLPAAGSATSIYGSISGTIYLDGQPGANLCATAYDGDTAVSFANTDVSGAYQLTSLPAGQYTVKFDDCGPGYTNTNQSAGLVDVAAGQDTPGIDGTLQSRGRVLGHVSAAGGAPLHGVCVHAANMTTAQIADTTTDANGNYALTAVVPGQTQIHFRACTAGNYVAQDYPDAIAVVGGQSKYGIDAVMAVAGHISGHIQNADGTPLANVCVFGTANGIGIPSAVTDGGGNYTIGEVPPNGTYKLTASDCWNHAYLNQDQTGTLVAPPTPTFADFTMQPAANISGLVTDSDGNGLRSVCISAKDQATGVVTPGWTRLDGDYDISRIPPGTYAVTFASCSPDSFLIPITFDDVAVPAFATVPLNPTLVAGGKITGHVRAGAGPLEGVCVRAADAETRTDGDGAYTLGPIPAGTYTVRFTAKGCAAGDWVSGAANDVAVTAGKTVSGVDATLQAPPVPDAGPAEPVTGPGASADPPATSGSQPQGQPTARPSSTPGCTVPKLKGKTLKKAKSLLKKAHCATGNISRKRAKGRKGTVIRTKPKPGKALTAGTKIALVVVR